MSAVPGFYSLKIKKLQRETDKAVTVVFEVPEIIKDKFQYKAGQFLTIDKEIHKEHIRRSYSICTSPYTDEDLAVTVKEVEGGRMSTYINRVVKEGDSIDVMPPNGKFIVELDKDTAKHYILFGGGSGITPLMGIIKTVLTEEPDSKLYLIYANTDSNSVIFKSQLESLEKKNKERLKIFYSYDKPPMMWFGLKGYLTEQSIMDVLKFKIGETYLSALYYLCGPVPMMDVVKTSLGHIGVPVKNIFNEYFGATSKHEEKLSALKDSSGQEIGQKSKVKITLYGKETEIEVGSNETILDAAIAAGLQPPYSCTVGVCTTCRAKILEGDVEMIEREGLSDSEINEGYILTCQSLPRESTIEINYDL